MSPVDVTIPFSRRKTATIVIIGALAVIAFRFFWLQVIDHAQFVLYAENNSIREVKLPAPRGLIYDRNGIPLVSNRPSYNLAVIPAEVRSSIDRLRSVDQYIQLPATRIDELIAADNGAYQRFQPFSLRRNVDFGEVSILEEHRLELPGIFFLDTPVRHYPSQANLSHVLGYLRSLSPEHLNVDEFRHAALGDLVGATGIERRYDRILKGVDGYSYRLVDNLRRDLGEIPGKPKEIPQPGGDLYLAIDVNMQRLAESLMDSARGALLAMEPSTGHIFIYVSAPDYPLASFSGPLPFDLWSNWNESEEKLLLNRPVDGLYPPGSILKVITVAAALEYGRVDTSETIVCDGSYQLGDRVYHCHELTGHGRVNMMEAVRYSCNIYFYTMVQRIGFELWADMAHRFGFGKPTGIDFQQEASGLVPSPEYMNQKYTSRGWSTGNLLSLAIGQGDILATPIQVLNMMAAIANRGTLVTPRIVINSGDHESPGKTRIDLKPGTFDFLQRALYGVVNHKEGTGRRARIASGRVYGKTGTAENPHGDDHAWFAGYVELPSGAQMAICVLVENAGRGSQAAAPFAAKLFKYYASNYYDPEARDLAEAH